MRTSLALVTCVCISMICAASCVAQDEEVPAVVKVAIADLAGRLRVSADEIKVVKVEEVTWPDASLGNPQPGMVYAQVLVPGYKVILEARGTQHEYHTDRTNRAVYVGEVAQVTQPTAVGAAIADLAGRLRIAPEQVEPLTVEEVQWPNSALGWPEPGMMYTQALVPGYRVILGAEGRQFEYHTTEQAAGKLGGMHFDPETTTLAVFAMQPIAREDANNFFDLHLVDPTGDGDDCVVEGLGDFAPTLDGRDLLIIRRLSRSAHEMLLKSGEAEEQSIAKAFLFAMPTWSPLGERFAYWAKATVGAGPADLKVGRPGEEPVTIEPPEGAELTWHPVSLFWTLEGLVVSFHTSEQGDRKTYFWDGETVSEVGEVEVLAWLPGTSSVIAICPGADGAEALVSVHLPSGQQTPLISAAKIISAAPLPGQGKVLAAIEDDDGKASLVSVTFGGHVNELRELAAATRIRLQADPLGAMCAINYTLEQGVEALILQVGERAETVQVTRRLEQCPKAVPVMQVRITRIVFGGNTLVSDEELSGAIVSRPGHLVDGRAIRHDGKRIEHYYEKQGYIAHVTEAGVDAEGVVTFLIKEVRIEQIVIEGLVNVKEEVVQRALGIQVGDLFDQLDLAERLRRVHQLDLFETIELDIRPGMHDPVSAVIVVVKLTEK